MRIYFDACCLNRPFDDQRQTRIHLETEAIETILSYIENGIWRGVSSDLLKFEIMLTPDVERRRNVLGLLRLMRECAKICQANYVRARALMALGLKTADALHVACAEYANVDVFLTVDDMLLKFALQHHDKLRVCVSNPICWMEEHLP